VIESECFSGNYLHRVLLDGSRSFRYRNRLHTLLGLPRSEGVKVSYSSFPSSLSFVYPRAQLMKDFYSPEEIQAPISYGPLNLQDESRSVSSIRSASSLIGSDPVPSVEKQEISSSENDLDLPLKQQEPGGTEKKENIQSSTLPVARGEAPKQAELRSSIQPPGSMSLENQSVVTAQPGVVRVHRIPELRNLEVPSFSKNESPKAAEIQWLSGAASAGGVGVHVDQPKDLVDGDEISHGTQAQMLSVPEQESQQSTQVPSSATPPYTHASVPSVEQTRIANTEPQQSYLPDRGPLLPSAQPAPTLGSPTTPPFPRPPIKPATQKIHTVELITDADPPEQITRVPQSPTRSIATKDKVSLPAIVLSAESAEPEPEPTTRSEVPAPAQTVNILWQREVPSKPRTHAFWERRHLSHYRLRLLR